MIGTESKGQSPSPIAAQPEHIGLAEKMANEMIYIAPELQLEMLRHIQTILCKDKETRLSQLRAEAEHIDKVLQGLRSVA